jgi:coatomer protein complex subunit alpha (xenin)
MDRFWVVAAHPDNFYFACGSDSALYVFTLFRDRVPCVMIGRSLCYGQRKSLKSFDTSSNIELTIRNLEMLSSINDNLLLDTIESISHNIYEQNQC